MGSDLAARNVKRNVKIVKPLSRGEDARRRQTGGAARALPYCPGHRAPGSADALQAHGGGAAAANVATGGAIFS